MTITCPACRTRFRIQDDRVSRPGMRARCGKCEHVFFVDPPGMGARHIAEVFLGGCLLLDLETSTTAGEIFQIGAILGSKTFEKKGRFDVEEALAALDEFGRDAQVVLGHNIIQHDLPVLASIRAKTGLLQLPAIDTLYLSPLAFPENPYHRLVKNYKLVRDSRNHPVADARLAGTLFLDQWESFPKPCEPCRI